MTKKKLWSKLPKRDKKHLREMNIHTKYQFEKQVEHIKKIRDSSNDRIFVCWDCIDIAKKLGMWED